ncbi:MAG: DUF2442 domain-containing protein [Candidatus Omnitrophica bacterium]|nr:DUF2442 domain-containing protein [Candidatus Omnitrophota bacterium]
MLIDVVSAEYRGDYKIKITFEDGKSGVIDFSSYLKKGGIFEKFKNIEFFKSFQLDKEIGNLIWNGEIDIAPETLYSKATRTPLPEWLRN